MIVSRLRRATALLESGHMLGFDEIPLDNADPREYNDLRLGGIGLSREDFPLGKIFAGLSPPRLFAEHPYRSQTKSYDLKNFTAVSCSSK